MKKIMFLLLFVPVIGLSQVIMPKEAISAVPVNGLNLDKKDVWLNILDQMKVIQFEQTPVGIKHLFDVLNPLLALNNLKSNKPTDDKSLYASYAKDIRDYENINLSVMAGDAEIELQWFIEPRNIIIVKITKKEYKISVM